MQHDWIPSTLGHGNKMCRRCCVTDLEAAAIGMNECEAPSPKAANENAQIEDHLYEDDESDEDEDNWEDEANCGRYPGSRGCSLAGTEYCDWSCPFNRPRV